MYSLILLFNKYTLSTTYTLGIVLPPGDNSIGQNNALIMDTLSRDKSVYNLMYLGWFFVSLVELVWFCSAGDGIKGVYAC